MKPLIYILYVIQKSKVKSFLSIYLFIVFLNPILRIKNEILRREKNLFTIPRGVLTSLLDYITLKCQNQGVILVYNSIRRR